jgi:hypothetical protein
MPQSTRLYTAGVAGAPQTRRVALNTQGSTQQGSASVPVKQSFATTAETQFTDSELANQYPLVLAIPPGGPCEQEEFDVVFSGYITTTQSSTVVFKLYAGSSATIGSNTLLASSTSETVATTTKPFALKATCVFDSVSGKLTGRFQGVVGATATALAVFAGAPPFALSLNNVNSPVLTFTLTVTFGTAATPNSVNLKDFGVNH